MLKPSFPTLLILLLLRLVIQIDYRDNLLKLSYDPERDRIRF